MRNGSSSERLVRAAQAGDAAAREALVARYQDAALAWALGWLGDLEEARDAAQEALVQALVSLERLREPAAFAAWLRRIVLARCDRRSRRRRPHAGGDLGSAVAADAVEDEVLGRSERAALRRQVERLPADERAVVALLYLAGCPVAEAAAQLGLSPAMVKKRAHAARGRLRE